MVYPEKEVLHVHETFNEDCPVGANIRASLFPIFEEAEKQLMLTLSSKNLQDLIKVMYTRYNKNKALEK